MHCLVVSAVDEWQLPDKQNYICRRHPAQGCNSQSAGCASCRTTCWPTSWCAQVPTPRRPCSPSSSMTAAPGQALEHARELYYAIHPSLLSWEYRLPSLLRELEAHGADIMCLQEVDHAEDLQRELGHLGYGPAALHHARSPEVLPGQYVQYVSRYGATAAMLLHITAELPPHAPMYQLVCRSRSTPPCDASSMLIRPQACLPLHLILSPQSCSAHKPHSLMHGLPSPGNQYPGLCAGMPAALPAAAGRTRTAA